MRRSRILLAAICLAPCACGDDDDSGTPRDAATDAGVFGDSAARDAGDASSVAWNDFLYWINGPRPSDVAATEYDLAVVDYSVDGTDATALSPADVDTMKRTPSGRRRTVLAYLSIGEAETYRYYWQDAWDGNHDGTPDASAPAWLGPVNPRWEGNYKVRYWDPGWQAILMGGPDGYLDKILAAGFDGVYLDIVDAYYYWAQEAPRAERLPIAQTADRMISLIQAIHDYGAARQPGFLVFPQNGEEIASDVANDGRADDYFAAIAGIGVEDVFFPGDRSEDNAFAPDTSRLDILARFVSRGEIVLSIDYLTAHTSIDRFYDEARGRGFVPFAGRRDLASIPDYPGPR